LARIAVDAMGGDLAPHAPITGALLALRELAPEHSVVLVGRTAVIQAELDRLAAQDRTAFDSLASRVGIVEAPDVIEMSDRPTAAIRGKPHSSMVVGLTLHASEKADAFVSAGNTGAQMASSVFLL
jgi:glycerol-3-phosphate acyltransferase PlsX